MRNLRHCSMFLTSSEVIILDVHIYPVVKFEINKIIYSVRQIYKLCVKLCIFPSPTFTSLLYFFYFHIFIILVICHIPLILIHKSQMN